MRFLACFLLVLTAGCNSVTFSKTEVTAVSTNTVQVRVSRCLWATESYEANLTREGGSLRASKSTSDSVALGAVAEGVAAGLVKGVKP